jgi:molybdopterin-guanine dinucleotide biosynthesis protein A
MTESHHAVIFAGGKSSRMGEDKALLPFSKFNTLSEFQYNRLSKLFQSVSLSAKENKFDFDCSVIEDIYQEHSPLVGIISIFETLQVEEVFILSVDAPFVESDTIEKILRCNEKGLDAIVAKSPGGVQPLCGLYKKSILPLARQQLKKNNHRLGDLLRLAHTCYVKFDEDLPFTNLNHPQEYQEALKRF